MTNAGNAAAQGSAAEIPRWALILLATAAALELLQGLSDLPILFGDTSEIPGLGIAGWIIKAKLALLPIVALAALILAASGRLRQALLAMAAVVLLTWLSYLPSVFVHGLEFEGDGTGGLITLFQLVLAPVLVVVVAALALRGERLTLAAVLAVVPTMLSVVFILLFAVGVAIYGF